MTGAAGRAAQRQLEGLGESVIDIHPLRQRYIHPGVQRRLGQRNCRFVIDGQITGWSVVVTNRLRGGPDAKWRHHVVKEAVVMIGPEQHDQVRVKAGDESPRRLEGSVDPSARFPGWLGIAHQRRM